MKDRGCGLLLPLAIVGVLAGLRHHTDSLAEQETQFTRQPEVFRRHYRAGDDGRVEVLASTTAPDGLGVDVATPDRFARAQVGCRHRASTAGTVSTTTYGPDAN